MSDRDNPIPWIRPCLDHPDRLADEIRTILESGVLTNHGPVVQRFEQGLVSFLSIDDGVLVSSGSAALQLAIAAMVPGPGKAVLPSFTYVATLNAVIHQGLSPVFCDIDLETWTMSPEHLKQVLEAEPAVRVVIPVNVFGVPPDLAAISELAGESRASVLYDNAHGFGTRGKATEPVATAFSFHATKLLPAVEGGFVTSPDPEILDRVRTLRNHGLSDEPSAIRPGFNAKMSELHAVVGLASLGTITEAIDRRRSYAARLRDTLANRCNGAFTVQRVPDDVASNWQNLGVLCPKAAKTYHDAFLRHGVQTRRYFYPPLHTLGFIEKSPSLPITERVFRTILCLPLHSRMDDSTLERIEAAAMRTATELT